MRHYGYRYWDHDRRERHAREGEELSCELGGADKIVTQFLFDKDYAGREALLMIYEDAFGREAADYARSAVNPWASGRRRMSGIVLRRFCAIFPPAMPTSLRFEMVERIWKRHLPVASINLYAGPDAPWRDVMIMIRDEVQKHFNAPIIPDRLRAQFSWLQDKDCDIKEQILSESLRASARMTVQTTRQVLSAISPLCDGNYIMHSRTVGFGGVTLTIHLDPQMRGCVSTHPPRHRKYLRWWWLIPPAVAAASCAYLAFAGGGG